MITFENKTFPSYVETRQLSKRELRKSKTAKQTDEYFIYKLDEEEIVFNWVDLWFHDAFDVTEPYYKETVWSVKKVDEETSFHLYNRLYNPFSIRIIKLEKETSHKLKAMIHSIDDSSFGVWFNDLTLVQAAELRERIADYISSQLILNGNAFFKFAESLGCTEFDTN